MSLVGNMDAMSLVILNFHFFARSLPLYYLRGRLGVPLNIDVLLGWGLVVVFQLCVPDRKTKPPHMCVHDPLRFECGIWAGAISATC